MAAAYVINPTLESRIVTKQKPKRFLVLWNGIKWQHPSSLVFINGSLDLLDDQEAAKKCHQRSLMWQYNRALDCSCYSSAYQQPLKALIEEPLKVVSVNNCCVEMNSPQKNKLAVLCFPCVVTGNSLGKEKIGVWGWRVLWRLLFANSLCAQELGEVAEEIKIYWNLLRRWGWPRLS